MYPSNTSYNWEVSENLRGAAGEFDITPSTAGGGTTFTNPALRIKSSGLVEIPGTLQSDAAFVQSGYDYQTPLTGATITIPNATSVEIINPTGTIATLTLNMPASPLDGQRMAVACGQTVTTLTMSGNGATLLGGLTTCGAAGGGEWIYKSSNTTWFRIK